MVWCLSFLFHISFVMTGIYIFFSKFVTLTLVLLNFTDQLGILWLAGTMGKGNNAWRRLSKGRILESNIVQLSGQIVEPKRQLALRTTATLLLGIVVIYQRKFQYLVGEWSYWNLWNCGFVVNIYKKIILFPVNDDDSWRQHDDEQVPYIRIEYGHWWESRSASGESGKVSERNISSVLKTKLTDRLTEFCSL